MSTVGLKTNFNTVYRPAAQLKGFEIQDDEETSNGKRHALAPSVYYTGASPIFEYHEDIAMKQYADVISYQGKDDKSYQGIEDKSKAAAPSVSNPFDFPSLSKGNSSKVLAEFEYHDEQEDQRDSEAFEHKEKKKEFINMAKLLENAPLQQQQQICEPRRSPKRLENLPPDANRLDNPIFRVNYPDVVTDPSAAIPKPMLFTLKKKVVFEVSLSNVYSPWQFWCQCTDRSLDSLTNRLNLFYGEIPPYDLVIGKRNMNQGLVVAAKVFGIWQRAQIAEAPKSNEAVFVFLVDVGIRVLIPTNDVRYLLKSFAKEPVKAIRGMLAGVRPKYGHDWTESIRMFFFKIVAEKKLHASIRFHHEDEDVHELELSQYVSSSSDDIATLLTSFDLADRDSHNSESYFIPVPFSYQNI